LLVDLAVSALVDELAHGLEVRITVSNVWLDKSQHLDGSSVQLDEDAVVDLAQTEELKDLADLWGSSNDTTDANHERKVWLSRNEDRSVSLGLAAAVDRLALDIRILLLVLLRALEDLLAGGRSRLQKPHT